MLAYTVNAAVATLSYVSGGGKRAREDPVSDSSDGKQQKTNRPTVCAPSGRNANVDRTAPILSCGRP